MAATSDNQCEERRKDIYAKIETTHGLVAGINTRLSRLEGKYIVLAGVATMVIALLMGHVNVRISDVQRQLGKIEARQEKLIEKAEIKRNGKTQTASIN